MPAAPQRLTRFVGKAKAMEMCLTGRMMDAEEAERSGLVSRIVPAGGSFSEDALKTARGIAGMSITGGDDGQGERQPRLRDGRSPRDVRFERRVFHAVFATADQKEGMSAFVDKRKPDFKDA